MSRPDLPAAHFLHQWLFLRSFSYSQNVQTKKERGDARPLKFTVSFYISKCPRSLHIWGKRHQQVMAQRELQRALKPKKSTEKNIAHDFNVLDPPSFWVFCQAFCSPSKSQQVQERIISRIKKSTLHFRYEWNQSDSMTKERFKTSWGVHWQSIATEPGADSFWLSWE